MLFPALRSTIWSTFASAPFARSLIALLAALALASAPAMGVAWPDVRPGNGAEPGAVAGVVPLVADPGHRMGGASFGGATPVPSGYLAERATWSSGTMPVGLATSATAAHHQWLRSMLIGARQQTDGG